jgi:hypothetical protein
MLSPTAWGAGGSTVAVPSRATVSAAAKVAALEASAMSTDGFGTLFLGGMTSSSDKHGGRQCCSRPKPSNTGSPQGLTGKRNNKQIVGERNEGTYFIDLVLPPFTFPQWGYLYTPVGFS